MPLPSGAVPETHAWHMRRASIHRYGAPLPKDDTGKCFRFTGAGDRPCGAPATPLSYAIAPWTIPWRSVPLDALMLWWAWSNVDAANPLVYTDSSPRVMNIADDAWVEVTRFASRTSRVGSDGGGYGLWFWVLPGSGVGVNIGKAVRFVDKPLAIAWARSVLPKGTDKELACNSGSFSEDSCDTHDDLLLCRAALLEGYDSLLLKRKKIKFGHVSGRQSDVLELVLCPRQQVPEQTGACPLAGAGAGEAPLIEYRLAEGGFARTCTCNTSAEFLGCAEFDVGTPLVTVSGTGTVHAGRRLGGVDPVWPSGSVPYHTTISDFGTRPVAEVALFALLWIAPMVALFCCVFSERAESRRRGFSESGYGGYGGYRDGGHGNGVYVADDEYRAGGKRSGRGDSGYAVDGGIAPTGARSQQLPPLTLRISSTP
jgi:hypothetical protein